MAEPEKTPNPAEAVGAPATAAAADAAPPASPPPAEGAAAAAPPPADGVPAAAGVAPVERAPAAAGAPTAEGAAAAGAPAAEGAAAAGAPGEPAEPPPPVELTEEELKAIEDEERQAELERMRLEDIRNRELEAQRKGEEEQGKRIVAARLLMLAEFQHDTIDVMKKESLEIQKRVVAMQKKKSNTSTIDAEQFILEGQEAYYYARLDKWNEKKAEFARIKEAYDNKIENLREMLERKTAESNARHEGLIHYFWKIARDSQDIVTYQRIPRRVLQGLEQEERDTIQEMSTVRIRGRQLKKQLARLELRLALKDQLQLDTGNLHFVDYEQLKMECEALDQKIQMKNEALSTLRKKTAYLVHMLQHIREKLQFLAVGCQVKGQELAVADKALHGGRIKNSHLKTSVVNINRKRDQLQRGVVYIQSPLMLDDMDYQKEDIETEEQNFQDLKKRYHELTVLIQKYRNQLYAMKAIPLPTKKVFTRERPPTPPIERGSLRWGQRRVVLGQQVVDEMVDLMAEQSEAKPKYNFDAQE